MGDSALRQGELSVWEAAALSIAIMSPTATMAFAGGYVSVVGSAVTLSFLVAAAAVGIVSFSVIQFARYFAHCGSLYAFAGIAMGWRAGFLAGWALWGTYVAFAVATIAETASFAQVFLHSLNVNVTVDWLPLALVFSVLTWFLAHNEVKVSARIILLMVCISILPIALLSVVILEKVSGSGGMSAQPFAIGGHSLNDLGLVAAFGFSALVGFEGAVTLGEESRHPRRTIPLAILIAVVVSGIVLVIGTYVLTVGFGTDPSGVQELASSLTPFEDLGNRYIGVRMATAVDFGTTISAFAADLAIANAGARLLYAMGRDGFYLGSLSEINGRTGTPTATLRVVMTIAIATILVMRLVFGVDGQTISFDLFYIGGFTVLFAYALANIGALRFFVMRRIWSWQFVIPVIALAVLGYVLYRSVYPAPSPPLNYLLYIALAWLVAGLAISGGDLIHGDQFASHVDQIEANPLGEYESGVPRYL